MKRFLPLAAVIVLAGCSLLNSPPAEAGTVVATWVNPTLNVDDSPIPAAQGQPEALQSWRIEWGTCAAGNTFGTLIGSVVRERVTGGPELTTATVNVPAGPKCFRVMVANFAGNYSDASNVAARDVPASKPRPPINVTAVLQGS